MAEAQQLGSRPLEVALESGAPRREDEVRGPALARLFAWLFLWKISEESLRMLVSSLQLDTEDDS